jgi:hypothetical protein
MFEDLIATLDDLGVTYTEDYEGGVLDIDIADIDKDTLVSVITAINDAGYTFSITDSNISVEGGTVPEESEGASEGSEDYMGEALNEYGQ